MAKTKKQPATPNTLNTAVDLVFKYMMLIDNDPDLSTQQKAREIAVLNNSAVRTAHAQIRGARLNSTRIQRKQGNLVNTATALDMPILR